MEENREDLNCEEMAKVSGGEVDFGSERRKRRLLTCRWCGVFVAQNMTELGKHERDCRDSDKEMPPFGLHR